MPSAELPSGIDLRVKLAFAFWDRDALPHETEFDECADSERYFALADAAIEVFSLHEKEPQDG